MLGLVLDGVAAHQLGPCYGHLEQPGNDLPGHTDL